MRLSNEDIQDILNALARYPFRELRIEMEHQDVTLRRNSAGEWTQIAHVAPRHQNDVLASGYDAEVTGASGNDRSASIVREGVVAVVPPLRGIFYRAPKPGSPPFVEVGSHVNDQTVIGIVETMKLMNTVYAGVTGTIAEIVVDDGLQVGENSILMLIAPEIS